VIFLAKLQVEVESDEDYEEPITEYYLDEECMEDCIKEL